MRLLPLCLFSFFLIPGLLFGQNSIVVTSGADSGPGTFRQAVADIDAGGTISFSVSEVYLDSTLTIKKDLIIDGSGLVPSIRSFETEYRPDLPLLLFLDADIEVRFVDINCFYGKCIEQIGGRFTMHDATVYGYSEGPTFNFDQTESVSLDRVMVSYESNPLGGVGWGFLANSGDVTILNSSIPSDISNSGANFLISDSGFGAFRGYYQWAVADFINNSGSYEIRRSTASGGVKVGVMHYAGTGKIVDSIIYPALNEIGEGGYAVICNSGQLDIWNSTLLGQFNSPNYDYDYDIGGLKIAAGCELDLYSTAIQGTPGITDDASTVIDGKFNLISDRNADPFIDLAFTSGSTPSHLSPLLDQGDCSLTGSILDRRRSNRPVDLSPTNAGGGDGCDIGAIEAGNENPSGFKIAAKVALGGAWDGQAMAASLAANGQIPLQQPYDGIPDTQIDQAFLDAHPEIVDWVWVELRAYFGSNSLHNRRAALLTDTGDIISNFGDELTFFAYPSSYHIVIGHRNHLPIMTANKYPVANGSVTSVDLSSDATEIYVNPNLPSGTPFMELGNGIIGLWPGDVSGNATAKYSGAGNDRVLILEQAGGPSPFDFVTGYLSGDTNLDGKVSYAGAQNDRVLVLEGTGGPTSFDERKSHVPNL